MESSQLEAYCRDGIRKVPGWFRPTDVTMFRAANSSQQTLVVKGDILEIGCYRGRSAILLGLLCGDDEAMHVCDLFEEVAGDRDNQQENRSYYEGLSFASFSDHYLAVHPTLPVVHAGPSSDLASVLSTGTFRLVHVDGSHLYEHVVNDLELAREILVDDGLVIFDDFRSPHAPGVAAAVWGAVKQSGLCPLAVSGQKLYATWSTRADVATEFHAALGKMSLDSEVQSIAGHRVVRIAESKQAVATHQLSRGSRLYRDVVPPAAARVIDRLRKLARARGVD